MKEREWLRLRDRWKKRLSIAKNIVSIGLILVGIGVWLLPSWWMRFVSFGIWLVFVGYFAYQSVLSESPPVLKDEEEETESLKDRH